MTSAAQMPPRAMPRAAQSVTKAGSLRRAAASAAAGFTLIELMITISIGVILFTVGIPGFSALISNQVLSAEARNFSVTLALARSQARARKTQISICKSTNGTSCTTLDTDQWEDGWILFVDTSTDGLRQTTEMILRRFDGLGQSFTLRPSAEYADYVAFRADGRAFGSGDLTPPTEGSYRFCDGRGAGHARVVDISPIGRSRVDPDPGASSCP